VGGGDLISHRQTISDHYFSCAMENHFEFFIISSGKPSSPYLVVNKAVN